MKQKQKLIALVLIALAFNTTEKKVEAKSEFEKLPKCNPPSCHCRNKIESEPRMKMFAKIEMKTGSQGCENLLKSEK